MTISALLFMIITQMLITVITIYFFIKSIKSKDISKKSKTQKFMKSKTKEQLLKEIEILKADI